jgi:hypothetical protein
LCFKSIFDKEFYVFPCQHAFHRKCIENRLRNYKTNDIGIKVNVDKLKSLFDKIASIEAKRDFL